LAGLQSGLLAGPEPSLWLVDQSPDLGIVVHVPNLRPSQSRVHTILIEGNVDGNSKIQGKRCKNMGPYPRLNPGTDQSKRGLIDWITGSGQSKYLDDRALTLLMRAETYESAFRMSLRHIKRERTLVRIEDHDPGGDRPARRGRIDEDDLSCLDASRRRVEAVERWLEAGDILLEYLNRLFRRYGGIAEAKTENLLAQLTEPIYRTNGTKTIDVEISRFFGHGRHKQLGNRFGPACQIHQGLRFLRDLEGRLRCRNACCQDRIILTRVDLDCLIKLGNLENLPKVVAYSKRRQILSLRFGTSDSFTSILAPRPFMLRTSAQLRIRFVGSLDSFQAHAAAMGRSS